MDISNLPDPQKVSNWKIALRWGAIWAGIGFLFSIIGFLTDSDPAMPNTSATLKTLYFIVGIGIAAWLITTAIREDRDGQLGGFISLGRCVGLGAKLGLVTGVTGGILQAIYTTLINPDYAEAMKASMEQQYADRGMSEEQIEQAMQFAEAFTGPLAGIVTYVIAGLLMGVIISLIAGAFMKKEVYSR